MPTQSTRRVRARKVLAPLALGLAVTAPIVVSQAVSLPGIATAAISAPIPRVSVVQPINAMVSGPGAATVTWGNPIIGLPTTGPAALTGYRVTAYSGGVAWGNSGNLPTSAHSYTFTGLTAGRVYVFRVQGINGAGLGVAADSNKLTIITTPVAPSDLRAVRFGGVRVNWVNLGGVRTGTILHYTVMAFDSSGVQVGLTVTVPGSELSYGFDSTVSPSIASVSVSATNAAGTGPASVVAVASPADIYWWGGF